MNRLQINFVPLAWLPPALLLLLLWMPGDTSGNALMQCSAYCLNFNSGICVCWVLASINLVIRQPLIKLIITLVLLVCTAIAVYLSVKPEENKL